MLQALLPDPERRPWGPGVPEDPLGAGSREQPPSNWASLLPSSPCSLFFAPFLSQLQITRPCGVSSVCFFSSSSIEEDENDTNYMNCKKQDLSFPGSLGPSPRPGLCAAASQRSLGEGWAGAGRAQGPAGAGLLASAVPRHLTHPAVHLLAEIAIPVAARQDFNTVFVSAHFSASPVVSPRENPVPKKAKPSSGLPSLPQLGTPSPGHQSTAWEVGR